jgi:hypothetical protein
LPLASASAVGFRASYKIFDVEILLAKKTPLARNFTWQEKDARPRRRNGDLFER